MISPPCAACCIHCTPRADTSISTLPYVLDNYLQAGTISLPCIAPPSCSHEHASDAWHTASPEWLVRISELPNSSHTTINTAMALAWLVDTSFAAATWAYVPIRAQLLLRVYLIPEDLPKTGGALMQRDQAVFDQAAEHMRLILSLTQTSAYSWHAQEDSIPPIEFFLREDHDDRTLAELYSQLPSPPAGDVPKRAALPGLSTNLYRYQLNSVAQMKRQEERNALVTDPTYIAVKSVETRAEFWFRPSTMRIRLQLPTFELRRGGILCEEMGLGKTIMMLALILSSRSEIPRPESVVDAIHSPLLTPIGVRRLPAVRSSLAAFARHAGVTADMFPQHQRPPPNLTDLLLHSLRLESTAAIYRMYEMGVSDSELAQALVYNSPFYLRAPLAAPVEESRRSPRKRSTPSEANFVFPRKIYATSATLIIVPATLFRQWQSEIEKHCEEGALRCYFAAKGVANLPTAAKLASQYDVVILTHDRFAREINSAKQWPSLATWNECNCPSAFGAYDVPDCVCGKGVSPLVQIHWQRVAIDEGHSLSYTNSQLVELADMLIRDSMWIITGTPTTNLVGFGLAQTLPASEFYSKEDPDVLVSAGSTSASTSTREDRADLAKLESLVVSFLHLPQVTGELGSHHFRQHVAAPFLKRRLRSNGSVARPFGAVQVMQQVMQQCMIRHRMPDVEVDVDLPPLIKNTVRLDLHPLGAITYNVILALVAGNAVDSERRDQDWFFHAANRGALNAVVQNLSQCLFWHADADALHDDMTIHVARAKSTHRRAIQRGNTPEDIELSRVALEQLETAANHRVWMPMMAREQIFVPFRVHSLPEELHGSWTVPQAEGPLCEGEERYTAMGPDRLLALRKWVQGHPLSGFANIAEHGRALQDRNEERVRIAQERIEVTKGTRKRKRSADVKDKQKRALGMKMQPSTTRENAMADIGGSESCSSSLLRDHPLSSVRIGESTSSKLNYVLREVLHHRDDKFLIFSNSPLSLAHLGEALLVARVSHLKITSEVDRTKWSLNATTFQSSEGCRCLLMELQYGARGLNLTSANRIIFLEPVWRADEESQAIKRAHRIGQTRKITVTTLAINGTVEEAMVQRKQQLQGAGSIAPKDMVDETHMRSYVQNPVFLPVHDGRLEQPELSIPLLPTARPADDEDDENQGQPPPKRVRVVRFAD